MSHLRNISKQLVDNKQGGKSETSVLRGVHGSTRGVQGSTGEYKGSTGEYEGSTGEYEGSTGVRESRFFPLDNKSFLTAVLMQYFLLKSIAS